MTESSSARGGWTISLTHPVAEVARTTGRISRIPEQTVCYDHHQDILIERTSVLPILIPVIHAAGVLATGHRGHKRVLHLVPPLHITSIIFSR